MDINIVCQCTILGRNSHENFFLIEFILKLEKFVFDKLIIYYTLYLHLYIRIEINKTLSEVLYTIL